MYIKTNGIVLRETQYRDSDKLLTLMTQELGKLTVTADGEVIAAIPLVAAEAVERLTYWDIVQKVLKQSLFVV